MAPMRGNVRRANVPGGIFSDRGTRTDWSGILLIPNHRLGDYIG